MISLSIDYLLKTTGLVTRSVGGEVLSGVVYLAISQANLKAIFRDPAQALRYAGFSASPTNTERQPVSVLAIARELDLPYETTRRHVGKLLDSGYCRREPDGGVFIPDGVSSSPAAEQTIDAIWRLTLEFVCGLAGIGVRAPTRRKPAAPDMRRIASRQAIYYVLSLIRLARTTVGLNVPTALLLLAIVRANTQHLTQDPESWRAYAFPDDIPPDSQRRPVTTYALARGIDLPYETARRQVKALIDAGLCDRRGKGLIIPAAAMRRPDFRASIDVTWTETGRFLAALGELGIGAVQSRRWLRA